MEITYTIKVEGFDNVPHKKDFYRIWLADGGVEGLMKKARELKAF